MPPMTEAALDLSRYLRPGDRVVWGQGCAEPQTLTELLVRQRHRLGGVTCFVGLPAAEVIRPEHTDALALESYCGTGSNVRLYEAGALAIVPVHYGALPGLLAGGGSPPTPCSSRCPRRTGRGGTASAWPTTTSPPPWTPREW